jgi:hypothetical protein
MKIYATEESLEIDCPACGVKAPVCCGYDINGPLVHERRYRKAHRNP